MFRVIFKTKTKIYSSGDMHDSKGSMQDTLLYLPRDEEKTPQVKVWFARWSKGFVFQQEFKSSGSFRRPPPGSLCGFSQRRRPCNCKSNCVHRSSGVHRSKHSHTGIQTLKGTNNTPESGAGWKSGAHLCSVHHVFMRQREHRSTPALSQPENVLAVH